MQEQESIEQKAIFNEELFRIEGSEIQQTIHRSIGAITYLNKNKKLSTGSGVIISKNLVLTAAHNIFDKILCCEHTGFKFYFGANGIAKDYYEVEGWKYPSEYQTCSNKQKLKYDYALLKLKKPVDYNQFLSVSLPCEVCLMSQNQQNCLQIFGYPGAHQGNFKSKDKFGKQFTLYQYGLARNNRITNIKMEDFKIGYGISTLGGQSGCPVVIGQQIIAVHNGSGREGEQFNVGRIITIDMLENLKKWCKQLNGQDFSIQNVSLCIHTKAAINNFIKSMASEKLHERSKEEIVQQQVKVSKQNYQIFSENRQIEGYKIEEKVETQRLSFIRQSLIPIQSIKRQTYQELKEHFQNKNEFLTKPSEKDTNLKLTLKYRGEIVLDELGQTEDQITES